MPAIFLMVGTFLNGQSSVGQAQVNESPQGVFLEWSIFYYSNGQGLAPNSRKDLLDGASQGLRVFFLLFVGENQATIHHKVDSGEMFADLLGKLPLIHAGRFERRP